MRPGCPRLSAVLVLCPVDSGGRTGTGVLLGIGNERLVAALGAEVISRTLVFRVRRCALWLDLHAANWIGLHDWSPSQ